METESKNKRSLDWRQLFVLAVAVTIVLRVLVAANPPFSAVYSYLLALPYAAAVYPALACARARRIPGFRLLMLGAAFAAVACVFHIYSEEQIAKLMTWFLMLLLATCICYPMAFLLPEDRAQRALTALSGLMIGIFAALSLLGVVLALTGNALPSLAGAKYAGISYRSGRLYAYLYPSAFALAAGLSLLLVPYVYGRIKGKALRALLLTSAALLYAGMALTGATIVQLVFAACAGAMVFLLINAREKPAKKSARTLLSLLLAAVALAVCFAGQWAVRRAADAIAPEASNVSMQAGARAYAPAGRAPAAANARLRQAMPAQANAEDETAPLGFIQLRVTLWRAAIRLFADEPKLLLTGTSPVQLEQRLSPYLPKGVSAANMRILPMQALAAFGVPGLLLTLAFAAYVLYHCVRLFFRGTDTCTRFERSLALLPLFCLLADCTDCYLTLTDAGGFCSVWFFLVSGYVVWLSASRITKRQRA